MGFSQLAPFLASTSVNDIIVQPLQRLKPPSVLEAALLLLSCLFLAAFTLQGKIWDRPDPYGYIYFERPQLQDGDQVINEQTTRDVAKHLATLQKDLVIFWGSQSGTAETLAQRLARDLRVRFGLDVLTADLSDYEPSSISDIPESKIAIFVLSTYGEGGPSDNAIDFWDWVCRDESRNLSQLRFLAFGLGNTNYKYYNKVADVVVEKLQQYGATLLSPAGRADDAQATTEEDYLAWLEDVHDVFVNQLHMTPKPVVYKPTLEVEEVSGDSTGHVHNGITVMRDQARISRTTSAIKPLVLHAATQMSDQPTAWNCLHVELDLATHSELRYKTGDHLAVWPVNPDEEVDRLLKALGRLETADVPLNIKASDSAAKAKVCSPTTLRLLLRHQLEICGPVPRNVATELVEFAPTEEARAFLARLGGDRKAYAQYRDETVVTIGSLLEHASQGAPWTRLPLAYLIETVPALQPRYYSISSSSVLSPQRLAITVRVTNTSVRNNAAVTIPGLASNYLLAMTDATKSNPRRHVFSESSATSTSLLLSSAHLHAQIRRTRFKPPVAVTTPMIMIANGTGIAPFRAFILERAKLHAVGRRVGPMMLFFGCRRPDATYLYRAELEAAQRTLNDDAPLPLPLPLPEETDRPQPLMVIRTAFSRAESESESRNPKAKAPPRYVQDALERDVATVVRLLDHAGASMYICGGAGMAREVGNRLARAYQAITGATVDQSSEWMAGFKRTGKWKEDVWD